MKQLLLPFYFFVFIATFFLSAPLHAQFCGTIGNGGISPELVARGATYTKWSSERSATITYVKVKAHIASQPGPGGDAATVQQLQTALDLANQYFLPGNIQFVLCGQPDIIEDFNVDWYNGPAYLNPYHVYGYVNITVVYVILTPPNVSGLGMPDDALVDGYALNSIVLAHELGHVLGLYHTHETMFGAELVNGSNCASAGDFICDTPADPNLSLTGMLSGCTYIGTVTDANSQAYSPMVNNIMSYAPWSCSNMFTTGQFNEMHYVLDSIKTYLRKPGSPVIITPFPVTICPYAADINLSAVPSGGTFSGAQVSGTVLDPQSGAPGPYSVSYIPTSPPEPAMNYIDQYSYGQNLVDTLNDIWQSFTTYETGTLTKIDFLIRNLSSTTFTFKLFSGTGTGGTLLYSS
ncbi:MAG TPA: M43 family zinc metalloprotease, partial [Bacteroidia bacterium]|nr:M43 family zinc metalloprotease [Bacteroidia bacterium]